MGPEHIGFERRMQICNRIDENIERFKRIYEQACGEGLQAQFRALQINTEKILEDMMTTLTTMRSLRERLAREAFMAPEDMQTMVEMDVNLTTAEVLLELLNIDR